MSIDRAQSCPDVQVWQIADRVLVATEVDGRRSDIQVSLSASKLMPLIAACPHIWQPLIASRGCRPILGAPMRWSAFVRGAPTIETTDAMWNSTLLIPSARLASIGWRELLRLRLMGVARVVMLDVKSSDGSIVRIELGRSSNRSRAGRLFDLLRLVKGLAAQTIGRTAATRPISYQSRSSLMSELRTAIKTAPARTLAPLHRSDSLVVLTHALPPGGAERQWCYLAGELKRQGYDVHFVTLWRVEGENSHYLPLLLREGVELTELPRRELDPSDTLAGVHIAVDRIFSGNSAGVIEDPFGSHVKELVELFTRLKPRAVFAQLDYCNLAAAAAGTLAQVPQIVLSFRNYNPSRFPHFAQDWFQPWYALIVQSPTVVLTGNSRAANADYAQWIGVAPSHIKLIPNAVDVPALTSEQQTEVDQMRREHGLNADTPVILGVFRLHAEKRPLLFVETFAAVLAELPHVRGFVVGVGPFEKAMKQRIDELKLNGSLTLLGRRDDVPQLMRLSTLLLLTSDFEGMPNVVLEAQAMGLPVIASNVGGVADCLIHGRTGYLVDRDDNQGLIDRCLELLQNHVLRNRFATTGVAHVRDSFSRRAMADRYLEVLAAQADNEAAGLTQRTTAA